MLFSIRDFRLIFLFILSVFVFFYSLFYPGKTLVDAVDRGNIVTVRSYLENGGTPNPKNFFESNPLFVAADRGQEEIVELLLKKGAKVNVYSMESTPLHQAVAAKNLNIVKMLVEHGAEINAIDKHNKKTPLDYAMFVNDSSITSYLRKHGALYSAKLLRKKQKNLLVEKRFSEKAITFQKKRELIALVPRLRSGRILRLLSCAAG